MFEEILQTAEARPKNMGPMRDATHYAKITGPCGDTDEIWLRVDAGRIRKASFMSDGCLYSVLCCAIAARMAEGLKPEKALQLLPTDILDKAGDVPPDHEHCAQLAITTLRASLAEKPKSSPPRNLLERIKRKIKKREPSK